MTSAHTLESRLEAHLFTLRAIRDAANLAALIIQGAKLEEIAEAHQQLNNALVPVTAYVEERKREEWSNG